MSAVVQTPEPQLRPMTVDDLDAVMVIELAVYPYPWTRRIMADCLHVGYRCRVGEIDGILAGYGIMSTGVGEAHILNLCVVDRFRRRGLGEALLIILLDEAQALKVNDVFLEVRPSNCVALRLYERLGFNQVGVRKDYYPAAGGREDAVIFALSLAPRD
jgi:ribosomal-protein-alanine N-acetyltransferase